MTNVKGVLVAAAKYFLIYVLVAFGCCFAYNNIFVMASPRKGSKVRKFENALSHTISINIFQRKRDLVTMAGCKVYNSSKTAETS